MDEDYAYNEWLSAISVNCQCPPCCADHPCGGVQQGAPCDSAMCHCFDEDYEDEEDEEEDGEED